MVSVLFYIVTTVLISLNVSYVDFSGFLKHY